MFPNWVLENRWDPYSTGVTSAWMRLQVASRLGNKGLGLDCLGIIVWGWVARNQDGFGPILRWILMTSSLRKQSM
ncbi:uncharacterized protein MYCGRDRAFT_106231 [Zymoseptoria tritici IPO323]|uniref:Uncharacterized protein n=1 Tax=Zymoseptoria tritici (strain CBS 115943 / IPO323) TaxID=336722 RepID=F9XM92_ZYMTI|nr:uncharacterized protein MYCGRDRAFT_106231 [Zymoseptoria tritici IPO323]EGP83488.1 hypothetical protein MYCGRDRAFT_106231 [Zymoseptoria tritici IPO323]